MNKIFTVALLLYCVAASAQNVVLAEYFIDEDAGFGNNHLFTLPLPSPDVNVTFTINLSGVATGHHKLYIRTRDSAGNWSLSTRRNIEVVSPGSQKSITGGEYFFDTDPGVGSATAFTIAPQDSIILQNFAAATSSLPTGYHKLYIRVKDALGKWSLTGRRNVEIINSRTYVIAGAEYFFNTDPGAGSANPVMFPSSSGDSSFSFKIPLAAIATGSHTLYIRARDSLNNNWSLTQWQADSVITSVQSGLWSDVNTWSNKKIPDSNTVVILHHNVIGDIDGFCKSLAVYKNSAQLTVNSGKKIIVSGHQ